MHLLYFVVLIVDSVAIEEMNGLNNWIFQGLVASGFMVMSVVFFKIYNRVFEDVFQEYGKIEELNRTLQIILSALQEGIIIIKKSKESGELEINFSNQISREMFSLVFTPFELGG